MVQKVQPTAADGAARCWRVRWKPPGRQDRAVAVRARGEGRQVSISAITETNKSASSLSLVLLFQNTQQSLPPALICAQCNQTYCNRDYKEDLVVY